MPRVPWKKTYKSFKEAAQDIHQHVLDEDIGIVYAYHILCSVVEKGKFVDLGMSIALQVKKKVQEG